MGLTVQEESPNLNVMRVSGLLKKSEWMLCRQGPQKV